ncbi:MAG: anti-sigma factor domain-containing protein [Ignavibacteriales bacterium]
MKNKGLLLEVRGNRGVVMTPDGRFESVPVASGDRVGDEVQFSPRTSLINLVAAPALRRKGLGGRAIAAALIIGLMLAFVGEAIRVQNTAVAYVEVDINPAVELGIDRNNRVVSVEGLDEDGRDVVAGLDLKHLDLEQAVTRVAGAAEEKGYVSPESEDNTVLITVTPARGNTVDPETRQRVEAARQAVSRTLESKNVKGTVQVIHTAPEVREEARKLNVPPGRLALMLKAKEQGIDVFAEVAQPAGDGEEQGDERDDPQVRHRDGTREDENDGETGDKEHGRQPGEEGGTERPGRQPGKAESGAPPGEKAGVKTGEEPGKETGETRQDAGKETGKETAEGREDEPEKRQDRSSARVLEEIIKGAKEEKDWPGLIEKFGEEIGERLKSATPPGQTGKKSRGAPDDGKGGDKMTTGAEDGEDDAVPGRPGAHRPQVQPEDQRRTGGESVWDRWRRGLGKTGSRGG